MLIHKTGIVLFPNHYKNWKAECVGDPTDTGGIYVILRHPDHGKSETFWEPTLDKIEQTLREEKITILWDDEQTISSFLDQCNLTKKLAKKIIHNFYDQIEPLMVFNITQLQFDFNSSLVTLSYYVEQRGYPDVVFSFEQLESLLSDYLTW